MAQPQRNDAGPDPASPFPPAPVPGYRPGGEVGDMQVDLARRLGRSGLSPADPAPGERVIRAVSVAGGVVLLAAAYAGVALLLCL